MAELWHVDHYEQNDDHPELNDHAAWTAHLCCGKQFLACHNDNACTTTAVEVTGNLTAARSKLASESRQDRPWPSRWLGPDDDASLWDEVCESLGLTRVGKPLVDFEDEDS